jgi:hypothetical protein
MSDKELNKPMNCEHIRAEQRLSAQNPRELTADEIDFVAGGSNSEAQVDITEFLSGTAELHEDIRRKRRRL